MITRCEIVSKEILPAVRAVFAAELKKKGLKQQEVASYLGVSQAAVSYYLNMSRGARAKKLYKNKSMMKIIREAVEQIAEADNQQLFCSTCQKLWKAGILQYLNPKRKHFLEA
ncbi:Fis family transcriptional regulator [Candidatus Micrarchaeota archaeon]|nr:MAG: Fis family transcriptional regulator [Candidatus Micrarchaeota archaeon]